MKNVAVLLVFVFSLVGVIHTVTAQAESKVRVEDAFAPPVLLEEDDSTTVIADKKKKKKGDKKDEDEESEEDYWSASSGAAALELVDPGALEWAARMSMAARAR